MRYYQPEHEAAYREIKSRGYAQWNDLFDRGGAWTYDEFQNRRFLEEVIPQLDLPDASATSVFEYGCGTGPAACFLAARGFQVEAIDLIPEAISIAQRMAQERGVRIAFDVKDVCALASEPAAGLYDLVVDSYCLQSIVTDQDRASVFAAVRARLKPEGYYLISTALHEPGRTYGPSYHFDASTGIAYREVQAASGIDPVVEIGGHFYAPYRRHLTAAALREELASQGFRVLGITGPDPGDVVCCLGM